MLFQHQDSIQRRIIWAQKSTQRNCIENTFCIMHLIKKKTKQLFNYLNTQSFLTFKKKKKKQLAATYSSKYNSTSYCSKQLWVYSEVLQRTCISLSFEKPRLSVMSPYRALKKL